MPEYKEATEAEIERNLSLQKHYPIGYVQAIFDLLESMKGYLCGDHKYKMDALFDALEDLDQDIRNNRYPIEIKTPRKKRRT